MFFPVLARHSAKSQQRFTYLGQNTSAYPIRSTIETTTLYKLSRVEECEIDSDSSVSSVVVVVTVATRTNSNVPVPSTAYATQSFDGGGNIFGRPRLNDTVGSKSTIL